MTCTVEGCPNPAARAGLCWTHYWRQRNEKPLEAELRPQSSNPWDRVEDALFDYLEVKPTDEAGWKRVRARLKTAIRRWAKAPKRRGRPPRPVRN